MALTPEQVAIGRRNFLKALAGVPPLVTFGVAAALRGPIRGGPVKAALIGTGRQGNVLLGQCRKEFVDLKALCDINPQRVRESAEGLEKLGWTQPATYQDWPEMLQKENLEAVLIATPLSTHADITTGCLDAGKHVLCEKMMAYDLDGCRRMVQAATRNRRVLEIGYNRFYSPHYHAANEHVIKPGILGDIYHVRLMYHRSRSWRRDIKPPSPSYTPAKWGYPTWDHLANWRLYPEYSQGLVAELGSHQIGTTNQYLGAFPTAALGSGGIYRFKDRQVNDHVYVILEYPQGRTVTFSSIESNEFDHITEQFMGTKGTLIMGREGEALLFTNDDKPTGIEVTVREGNVVLDASESRSADASGRTAEATRDAGNGEADRLLPYRLEIAGFCSAIRTGTALRCGPDMALRTAAAVLGANRAIAGGSKVPIEQFT
jgi:predicted dehydrogenase